MIPQSRDITIDELVKGAEIPDMAKAKAQARYEDLGDWFCRDKAHCALYKPYIYPQGSFRLGTVVRADEYDLDFGCRLQKGVTKLTHTQEDLKNLVRQDLDAYRKSRGIERNLEEKARCWRLHYTDELSFHMDGVPSIPENPEQRQLLETSMTKAGMANTIVQAVAQHAGAITDNRLANYAVISPDWRISNSEGYALWFESRMKLAEQLMEKRAFAARAGTVEELPAAEWNSPLQRTVQVLKCHRDEMFKSEPDGKPISIILTTLAASAYDGETTVAEALGGILDRMGGYVREQQPRVPNPVNPSEDFADKWYDAEYRHLKLEDNFWNWLKQAKIDFSLLADSRDPAFITEQARIKFGVALNERGLAKRLGVAGVPSVIAMPKVTTIRDTPAKPWRKR